MDLYQKQKDLRNVSNFKIARLKAKLYLGGNTELFISTRKDKKYMVLNPFTNQMIHFGSINYEDYTHHNDDYRRMSYLKRATHIKGEWKDNKYSPNNLSINILW